MRKSIWIAAVVALLAVGGAFAFWYMNPAPPPEPVALDPYDYTLEDSWHVRPDPAPPPVWEAGWATDVVLMLSPGARRAPDAHGEALSAIGPVYAPKLRGPEFDVDAAEALQRYLDADNNGRALVIASDRPLPASIVPVINSDPMVRARFAGVLLLEGQEAAFATGVSPGSVCSDRFGAGEICAAPLEIRRSDGVWIIAGDEPHGGAVIDGFEEWLDSSAPKLAEPLGELEEIEIIDIRRPGQTD
ncbi:MAG: hypothetical protein ACK4MQ_07820 [Hyphomonas sp.]